MNNNSLTEISTSIGEYISISWDIVLLILPTMLLYSFGAFVLSVIILIVIKRKGVLKRLDKRWDIVVKLNYLFIPSVFVIFGVSMGFVKGVDVQVNNELDTAFIPFLKTQLPTIKNYVIEQIPEGSSSTIKLTVQNYLAALYVEPKSDGVIDKFKAKITNWITQSVGRWVLTATVSGMLSHTIGQTLGLDSGDFEFTSDIIERIDLAKVDNSIALVVYAIVADQIRKVFKGLYINNFLMFFLVMLIPIAEILFYTVYWSKREPKKLVL